MLFLMSFSSNAKSYLAQLGISTPFAHYSFCSPGSSTPAPLSIWNVGSYFFSLWSKFMRFCYNSWWVSHPFLGEWNCCCWTFTFLRFSSSRCYFFFSSLLFVSSATKSVNCSVTFFPSMCFRIWQQGKILGHGRKDEELYLFNLSLSVFITTMLSVKVDQFSQRMLCNGVPI